jgi:D-alanyl-lipoteichoic acid acyltransferase DltB (MBOAT superfamily)
LDYLKESYIPAGSILRAAALCAAKSLLLVLAARFAGGWYFSSISASDFKALTHLKLWLVVYFNYATTVLWLSGTADFVVAVARACGIPLDFNYKFALLAWNPVEVWRRWAIYNRKLLLKLIYFPLGGNQRQVYRNIMATFLASAWVLHSGWIGSRYLEVGLEGWRDYSVYFIIQGLAVCGCLFYWKIIRKDSRSDRDLRFSPGRIVATVATQGFNAWVHVLILGQVGWTWGQRWELMGRLCGWS